MVSEALVRAVDGTFALQDFRDGVPVRVVILDAVLFHPSGDGDVIA